MQFNWTAATGPEEDAFRNWMTHVPTGREVGLGLGQIFLSSGVTKQRRGQE
jgi:hypothetical protein